MGELMNLRRALIIGMCWLLPGAAAFADQAAAKLEYRTESDIPYYDAASLSRADAYQKDQCKLDIYFPTGTKGYATVVWFHGGGLTEGARYFPDLKEQGIALVPVLDRKSVV